MTNTIPPPNISDTASKGPERPFFDPNNLPDIQDIELDYLKSCRKVNFNPGGPTVDFSRALRFIIEAGEGAVEDEAEYTALEQRAIGEVFGGQVDGEKLGYFYEALEEVHPRVPALMQRIREQRIFADEEFITLSKLALLATIVRFEH